MEPTRRLSGGATANGVVLSNACYSLQGTSTCVLADLYSNVTHDILAVECTMLRVLACNILSICDISMLPRYDQTL